MIIQNPRVHPDDLVTWLPSNQLALVPAQKQQGSGERTQAANQLPCRALYVEPTMPEGRPAWARRGQPTCHPAAAGPAHCGKGLRALDLGSRDLLGGARGALWVLDTLILTFGRFTVILHM